MRSPPRFRLPIRITHWLNTPLLLIMVWSGILIYWANRVYWPPLPDRAYEAAGIDHRLAEGMAYHFAFAWAWAINGCAYLIFAIRMGEIKSLFPTLDDLKSAPRYVLEDLGILKKPHLPKASGKFNPAQKIAYFFALLFGALSLLTGLAIHKPVQLHWIASAFGGYDTARIVHYVLAWLFVAFTLVHVIQVVRAGWATFRSMVAGIEHPSSPKESRRSRFAFLVLGTSSVLAAIGWFSIRASSTDTGIYAPLRTALETNGRFWSWAHSANRTGPTPEKPPSGTPVRLNGDLGLSPDPSQGWTLEIHSPSDFKGAGKMTLTLPQISWLPIVEITAFFRCIEGWSEKFSYDGIRFREFMERMGVGTRSGRPPDPVHHPEDLYRYVGLETPDGEYYVSIDMESMLHPQTLLATRMNGAPLTKGHGAPLRLVIPVKYGIKSLKQVGKIIFSDERPPDYWAERGYDWYAGL